MDACEGKDEEMEWVKTKIADIEDRYTSNNLKIRGSLNQLHMQICVSFSLLY